MSICLFFFFFNSNQVTKFRYAFSYNMCIQYLCIFSVNLLCRINRVIFSPEKCILSELHSWIFFIFHLFVDTSNTKSYFLPISFMRLHKEEVRKFFKWIRSPAYYTNILIYHWTILCFYSIFVNIWIPEYHIIFRRFYHLHPLSSFLFLFYLFFEWSTFKVLQYFLSMGCITTLLCTVSLKCIVMQSN